MTEIKDYVCPILNRESDHRYDVLVKIDNSALTGVICPHYNNYNNNDNGKCAVRENHVKNIIENIKAKYEKGADGYENVKLEIIQEMTGSKDGKISGAQCNELERRISREIESLKSAAELKNITDTLCLLKEGFQEIR